MPADELLDRFEHFLLVGLEDVVRGVLHLQYLSLFHVAAEEIDVRPLYLAVEAGASARLNVAATGTSNGFASMAAFSCVHCSV